MSDMFRSPGMTDKEYDEFLDHACRDQTYSALAGLVFGILLFVQLGVIMALGMYWLTPVHVLSGLAVETVLFFIAFGWAMKRWA